MAVDLIPDEDFGFWFANWSGEFEWNDGNSHKPEKHGLDTAGVEMLFEYFHFYAGRPEPMPSDWGEARDVVFLHDDASGKHYTAAVTRRGNALRVVTCRRARPKEMVRYDRERKRSEEGSGV